MPIYTFKCPEGSLLRRRLSISDYESVLEVVFAVGDLLRAASSSGSSNLKVILIMAQLTLQFRADLMVRGYLRQYYSLTHITQHNQYQWHQHYHQWAEFLSQTELELSGQLHLFWLCHNPNDISS